MAHSDTAPTTEVNDGDTTDTCPHCGADPTDAGGNCAGGTAELYTTSDGQMNVYVEFDCEHCEETLAVETETDTGDSIAAYVDVPAEEVESETGS